MPTKLHIGNIPLTATDKGHEQLNITLVLEITNISCPDCARADGDTFTGIYL